MSCELGFDTCNEIQSMVESLAGAHPGRCCCNNGQLLARLILKFPRRPEVVSILNLSGRDDLAGAMLNAGEPVESVARCPISGSPIAASCEDRGCPAWIPQNGLMCCSVYAEGFYQGKIDMQALRSMYALPESILEAAINRVREVGRSLFAN